MSRLKKFDYRIKDNRKRNTLLISICLLTIVVVGIKLYRSYAKFEVETTEYEVINGTVVEPINAVEYLTSIVDDNPNTMIVDDTPDENIRYMGANPNNYVKFNNELWRIIGVMNNVDGGVVSGDDASRVKIIRAESLGIYSWDRKCLAADNSCGNSTDTSVISYDNNWETSSLNSLLNTFYYNKTNSLTYNYINGSWQYANYSSNGINNLSKNLIENVIYYLGGYSTTSGDINYYYTANSSYWYSTIERGSAVYNGNPITWTGNLGLIYPSDYGYASSGTVSGNKCSIRGLRAWSDNTYNSEYINCRDNDWLYDSASSQWIMTPLSINNTNSAIVFTSGGVHSMDNYYSASIRPVAYLKSTVKIVAGPNSDGSSSKPYKLTI